MDGKVFGVGFVFTGGESTQMYTNKSSTTRIVVTNLDEVNLGFTLGHIHDEHGQVIEEGAFSFEVHEDEHEWDRLADAQLARVGWSRISDWVYDDDGILTVRVSETK